MVRVENEERVLTINQKVTVLAPPQKGLPSESIATEVFLDRLNRLPSGFQTPVLPQGTILYERNDFWEGVILQDPPALRTVNWTEYEYRGVDGFEYGREVTYKLAFPYLVIGFSLFRNFFLLDYTHVHVAYRNQAVTSLQDTLGLPNLPNMMSGSFRMCTGRKNRRFVNILGAAEEIRRAIWSYRFNRGFTPSNWQSFAELTTGPAEEWQRQSLKDQNFVLQINWPQPKPAVTAAGLLDILRSEMVKSHRFCGIESASLQFSKLTDAMFAAGESGAEERGEQWLG